MKQDTKNKIISEHTYHRFEDFYNDVIHYNGKFRDITLECNIFRGHSSENFELLPRSLRLNDSEIIVPDYDNASATNQERFEKNILMNFRNKANFHALQIPPFNLSREQRYWEHENFGIIAGLAQHYGLPTRLLDWTYELNTALYFALIGNIDEKIYEKGDYIVIWALDRVHAIFINQFSDKKELLKNLRFISPDYHTNPNLAAQKGVFTFWIPDKDIDIIDNRPLDKLIAESSEKFYRSNEFGFTDVSTTMYKFKIHKKNLYEIFKYLSSLHWDAARLFPGYAGVIKGIVEKTYITKTFKS